MSTNGNDNDERGERALLELIEALTVFVSAMTSALRTIEPVIDATVVDARARLAERAKRSGGSSD